MNRQDNPDNDHDNTHGKNILVNWIFFVIKPLLQGTVIAIDKTSSKVDAIRDRCQQFGISCVKYFVFDSTKAVLEVKEPEDGTVKLQDFHQNKVTEDLSKCTENIIEMKPPFPPETFDKILLDAPCSAMGQRPQIISSISLKQLKSYPPLQRKLFQAVSIMISLIHLYGDVFIIIHIMRLLK